MLGRDPRPSPATYETPDPPDILQQKATTLGPGLRPTLPPDPQEV